MTLHKVLKYLALVIGVIGLVLLGRIIYAGDDTIEASATAQQSYVTPFLYLAYLVCAVIILLVVIFVFKGLGRGNLKNTFISLGVFAAIILIAYLVSEGSETTLRDGTTLSATATHWVGTGLVTFYILAAIAVGTMVVSGVKKLIK